MSAKQTFHILVTLIVSSGRLERLERHENSSLKL